VLLKRVVESCREVQGGRGCFPARSRGKAPEDFGEASGCSQSAIAGEKAPSAFPQVFIWIDLILKDARNNLEDVRNNLKR
jgi:hypothetical protein